MNPMKSQDDPEWELVDSLPNERKRSKSSPPGRIRFPKKYLIGLGVLVGVIVIFPPAMRLFLNLLRNAVHYWWLVAIAIGYWFAKRRMRR